VGRKKHKEVPRIGRLRAAWYVLNGTSKTIEQIQMEWSAIHAQAAETFSRLNSLVARLARAEKSILDRQLESMQTEQPAGEPVAGNSEEAKAIHKAGLRARAAANRRGGYHPPLGVTSNVNGD